MFTGYTAFHDKDNDGGGGIDSTADSKLRSSATCSYNANSINKKCQDGYTRSCENLGASDTTDGKKCATLCSNVGDPDVYVPYSCCLYDPDSPQVAARCVFCTGYKDVDDVTEASANSTSAYICETDADDDTPTPAPTPSPTPLPCPDKDELEHLIGQEWGETVHIRLIFDESLPPWGPVGTISDLEQNLGSYVKLNPHGPGVIWENPQVAPFPQAGLYQAGHWGAAGGVVVCNPGDTGEDCMDKISIPWGCETGPPYYERNDICNGTVSLSLQNPGGPQNMNEYYVAYCYWRGES